MSYYQSLRDAIVRAANATDSLSVKLELSNALEHAKHLARIEPCQCCSKDVEPQDMVDIAREDDGQEIFVCERCAIELFPKTLSRVNPLPSEPEDAPF